ncbi:MAG: helix-turn-helix domain-containing protein [Candidatus Glassbacteria bacterium]
MPLEDISLIDERQLAETLGMALQTIRNWRHTGHGPAYLKIGGRSVRYRLVDVREFVERQRIVPDGSEN